MFVGERFHVGRNRISWAQNPHQDDFTTDAEELSDGLNRGSLCKKKGQDKYFLAV